MKKRYKFRCKVCKKIEYFPKWKVKKRQTCSNECKNKLHSKRMSGTGNSMYGKDSWCKGLTKESDKRILKLSVKGKKNGNYGGKFNGIHWSIMGDDVRKRVLKLISDSNSGRKFSYKRRAMCSIYGVGGFLDSNYRRYLKNKNKVKCNCCNKYVKVGGADGIYVHHLDSNRKNNKRDNLLFACPRCHNLRLHNRPRENFIIGWKKALLKYEGVVYE